jgi:hypothetical protein
MYYADIVSPSTEEYTSEEVEKILSSVSFGANLSDFERVLLQSVVRTNIKAFGRHKGDSEYTTLIEHETDLINQTPIKLRPYILSCEEQKAAAEYVHWLREGLVVPSKSPPFESSFSNSKT